MLAFSLGHLLWFVASICLVLSLFRFNHSLGIVVVPIAISLPVSHAVSPNLSAKVNGMVASFSLIFVVLSLFLVTAFRLNVFDNIDRDSVSEARWYYLFAMVFGASVLGGYLGGRRSLR